MTQVFDPTQPADGADVDAPPVRQNFAAVPHAIFGNNLLGNSDFLLWSAGDAAAPDHWTLSGAGATVARTGVGLADTQKKVGEFAVKVSAGGGALATLQQQLLPSTAFKIHLRGYDFSAGLWIRSGDAAAVRARIYDGVGNGDSAYHSGSLTGGPDADGWEWLECTRTLAAAADRLALRVEIAAGSSAWISGPTCVFGAVKPKSYFPSPTIYGSFGVSLIGPQAADAANPKFVFPPGRPGIVKDVQLRIETAPTGQDLIADIKTWDGSTWTSMFTSGARPKIVAGSKQGGAQPDGAAYARRCFASLVGATLNAGGLVGIFLPQVGSTVVGSDLVITCRVLQYARPLEPWLGAGDIG